MPAALPGLTAALCAARCSEAFPWAGAPLVVVRSLWEGRAARSFGADARLQAFLGRCGSAGPAGGAPLAADYALLAATCHKAYLVSLQAASREESWDFETVPTVLLAVPASPHASLAPREARAAAAAAAEGGAVGAVKRLLEAEGWREAVLKPAVGTRCEVCSAELPTTVVLFGMRMRQLWR